MIYTLIAAMLLVYVPTVRSYLNLRQAFAEASQDLDRQLLIRRFELFSVRQAAEYFDIAFVGEDRSELQAMAQAGSQALDDLRKDADDNEALAIDRLTSFHSRLQEVEHPSPAIVDDRLEARLKLFRDSMSTSRNDQLQTLVDEILFQKSSVFEDRLNAISGQLLWVPFVKLDTGAAQLRVDATEAIAAAAFAQHLERLILEYQDFAFLDGAWHKLYLARGETEQLYELWLISIDNSAASTSAISDDQTREVANRYRELNRLGDRLVDLSETSSKAEVLNFYQSEVEHLTDKTLTPALESILASYDTHTEASVQSVARRIDLVGYVLAVFAMIVVLLALISPLLMSRWIVQPVGALTQATQKLGSGDLSGPVVINRSDELGQLAVCFNQMVVDLKEAQDQLGRRERLVVLGQLAGSVAHEIRNPLGVMKNSIYFLRLTQKLKDEKAMQHLGLIEDEIARANRIIAELLDYARDSTSQVGLMVLQEAFDHAIAEVKIPESIRITLEFEDEPLNVMGDRGQIESILSNLLRNAIQAMPDGGALTVVCRRHGTQVIAEVNDTGIGIAEDQLTRIFEPLYTAKATGIGLGLPLSQRYASLNGGRIECQSEVGQGSSFRLVLPAPTD